MILTHSNYCNYLFIMTRGRSSGRSKSRAPPSQSESGSAPEPEVPLADNESKQEHIQYTGLQVRLFEERRAGPEGFKAALNAMLNLCKNALAAEPEEQARAWKKASGGMGAMHKILRTHFASANKTSLESDLRASMMTSKD